MTALFTDLVYDAKPVGAGLPAMGPSQPPLQWLGNPDQSVTIRECFWVSFMVMYTSNDTAMHAVTYQ